jgi:hypothetical protein
MSCAIDNAQVGWDFDLNVVIAARGGDRIMHVSVATIETPAQNSCRELDGMSCIP